MMKVRMAAALAAASMALALFAGCAGQGGAGGEEAPEAEEAPAATVESESAEGAADGAAEAPEMPDVSEDAAYTVEAGDPDATGSFILENGSSSMPVFGIAVRPAASGDPESAYTECPFTVGDRLVPQMRCLVRYEPAGQYYDVLVTYSDGTECEFTDVDLAALESPLRVE